MHSKPSGKVLPADFELPGPAMGVARSGSASRFRPIRSLIVWMSRLLVITSLGGFAAWYLGAKNNAMLDEMWRALKLVAG